MQSSALTIKGQVTIPAELRKKLDLKPGDKIGFTLEDDHIVLYRKENKIESSFGICHPKTSASSKDIKNAIRKRGKDASR